MFLIYSKKFISKKLTRVNRNNHTTILVFLQNIQIVNIYYDMIHIKFLIEKSEFGCLWT